MQDLIAQLNPAQREAVLETDGPVLVIAGAGSGKTRVITHRIAWLLSEKRVAPWEIFAATFTNKAAREMKYRVDRLCGAADTSRLSIATFHSLCAKILRREHEAVGLSPRFNICDDTDQIALLKSAINELDFDSKVIQARNVQEVVSLAKMALLEGEEAVRFIAKHRSAKFAAVYERYQQRLRESDAADFDDLLLLVANLWKRDPGILEAYRTRYRYVLVDEYQDTNKAQFEIVRLLAGGHRNLCVVGDEDQSIYSWRGAEISNLLDFQKHFSDARVIRLEQNYRSTGNILAAAHGLIVRNTQRLGKELWTESGMGDPVVLIEAPSETDEARLIARQIGEIRRAGLAYEEIALFYRVNALSRVYEEALREANIPYRVIGGVRFYDRAEIKDLLAYLQVVANPGNLIALLRVLNKPRRGIGDTAVSNLLQYARERGISLFETLATQAQAAGLKGKAAAGARDLAEMVAEAAFQVERCTLRQIVEHLLEKTAYVESLGDPKSIEVLSRIENIREFCGALDQYQEQYPKATLHDYLESIALRSADVEGAEPGVSLMTVHNAKGLEFDVVFIVAMEEELFPNARAVREQMHCEEERRLFYVALTRARRRVYVSNAMTRRLYGQTEWPAPSQFIREIPKKFIIPLKQARLGPLGPARPAPDCPVAPPAADPFPARSAAGGAPVAIPPGLPLPAVDDDPMPF